MVQLSACPEPTCNAPAEVTDRFTLESTDGPIEHCKTYCVRRHIFILPVEWVARSTVMEAGRLPARPDAASPAQPGRARRQSK